MQALIDYLEIYVKLTEAMKKYVDSNGTDASALQEQSELLVRSSEAAKEVIAQAFSDTALSELLINNADLRFCIIQNSVVLDLARQAGMDAQDVAASVFKEDFRSVKADFERENPGIYLLLDHPKVAESLRADFRGAAISSKLREFSAQTTRTASYKMTLDEAVSEAAEIYGDDFRGSKMVDVGFSLKMLHMLYGSFRDSSEKLRSQLLSNDLF